MVITADVFDMQSHNMSIEKPQVLLIDTLNLQSQCVTVDESVEINASTGRSVSVSGECQQMGQVLSLSRTRTYCLCHGGLSPPSAVDLIGDLRVHEQARVVQKHPLSL